MQKTQPTPIDAPSPFFGRDRFDRGGVLGNDRMPGDAGALRAPVARQRERARVLLDPNLEGQQYGLAVRVRICADAA
jgi:hypothetical protein